MADKPNDKPEVAAPAAEVAQAPTPEAQPQEQQLAAKDTPKPDSAEGAEASTEKSDVPKTGKEAAENATDEPVKAPEKPAADPDVDMKDASEDVAPEVESATAAAQAPATKGKTPRRKSVAGDSKKTLNKKGSKARLTHTDANPGDHFLVKLKGFPAWPAIICDETMLPAALIGSRPVSAARPDGSYSEAYADGGKRVHDRSFPVMYLYTNEFGWVQNTALSELSADKAKESITEKMRKDLKAAFELAAEHHAVDHYKEILKSFQEQIAQEEARKQAAATPKKSKKGKAKAADDDEAADAEDADMAPKSAKSKKRKAEEDASTPQRPDSIKKPKIKLNTSSTPKTTNGAATPRSAGGAATKSTKAKPKKAKEGVDKTSETAKEAKMTPEERRARKEKEVLYLRHKLQRGLLTREQQPREDEMKSMSDYISVLENFVDLEVSIIRATKINKVFKAILKLESIPREDEFGFKKRSQSLLDKWNKLLTGDASGPPSVATNGVNGADEEKKSEVDGVKDGPEEAKKDESELASRPKTDETTADEGVAEKSVSAEEKEGKPEDAEGTAAEPVAAEE